ncbi:MAG TPA: HAMP domain-containing sensor histidine kinase [Chloroflexota bacterium]
MAPSQWLRRNEMRAENLRQFTVRAFQSAYEQRHPYRLRPFLECIAGVGLLWAALALLEKGAGIVAPGSPYLLVILALALRWGLRVGLISSLLAVLAEEIDLPTTAAGPAPVPHALAHFILYAAVALSVGILASFYRRERLLAERAAEQERHAAEYQRRMVGILAHDLKAPITAVRGYMELARRHDRLGQRERADEALEIALGQVDRLTSMITNLVEASRIEQEALSLQAISFGPALNRLVTAFSSDPLHPLVVDTMGGEEIGVRSDPAALDRILDNLLSNAVKYSPEGGVIRISVRQRADRVVIGVSDQGIGVPIEEQEKIFAPYYRGSNQHFATGTGVGLYICRELASKMGGALHYSPSPAGGSLFSLELVSAVLPLTASTTPPHRNADVRALMASGQSNRRM